MIAGRKTNNDNIREFLNDAEMSLRETLPNPFGTFKKAKYEMYCTYTDQTFISRPIKRLRYIATTTCRDTEDMVNMIKAKRQDNWENIYIYKIQDGIKELVFKTKVI